MSALTDLGLLQEMSCGPNYAYLLAEGVNVLPTEYKVMLNPRLYCLVKCMRMKYNGRDQLFYLTAGMRALPELMRASPADTSAELLVALIKSVLEVIGSGFLTCQNIDLDLRKTFFDAKANRVRLTYLPIDKHFYPNATVFENELRSTLARQIDELPQTSPRLAVLRERLSNPAYSLQSLTSLPVPETNLLEQTGRPDGKERLRKRPKQKPDPGPEPSSGGRTLFLIAKNAPMWTPIRVDRSDFRIGKNPDMDCVLTFNKFIDPIHCVIIQHDEGFFVTDLNSKGGTFVNHTRLEPDRPYPLQNGDLLGLANSVFEVSIK